MTLRDTSLYAWFDLIESKRLGKNQEQVYNVIKNYGPLSDKEISERLGWPINQITNRRGELEDRELVRSFNKIRNNKNRLVHVWVVNEFGK